jgi:hypothetical protein
LQAFGRYACRLYIMNHARPSEKTPIFTDYRVKTAWIYQVTSIPNMSNESVVYFDMELVMRQSKSALCPTNF